MCRPTYLFVLWIWLIYKKTAFWTVFEPFEPPVKTDCFRSRLCSDHCTTTITVNKSYTILFSLCLMMRGTEGQWSIWPSFFLSFNQALHSRFALHSTIHQHIYPSLSVFSTSLLFMYIIIILHLRSIHTDRSMHFHSAQKKKKKKTSTERKIFFFFFLI